MKKQVIGTSTAQFITLEGVSPEKYYGVNSNKYERKGFVARERWRSGSYKVMAMDGCTHGNAWTQTANESLEGCLRIAVEGCGMTVFQFDTEIELFQWLAEPVCPESK